MRGGWTRMERGFALWETLVSTVVLSLSVAVSLRLAFSSVSLPEASNRHDWALQAAYSAAEKLRNYVTAEASPATAPRAPHGSWAWPQHPGKHALAAGPHETSHLLPARLRGKGYTMSYHVADVGYGVSQVAIILTW